jgi:16S rRNA (guanine966-N2)-methyltransferase
MTGMRVIGGTAKGRRLKMKPGTGTRPITDRVKESLFNILGPSIEEAVVLDLFAGTGGVGIEALSRGAASAVFVERDRAAVGIIRENLRTTELAERAQVVRADVFTYLRAETETGFDYIHIAPPQYKSLWIEVLQALDARPDWLNPRGEVVAQIDPLEFSEVPLQSLVLADRRKYGSTLLCFYGLSSEREGNAPEPLPTPELPHPGLGQ